MPLATEDRFLGLLVSPVISKLFLSPTSKKFCVVSDLPELCSNYYVNTFKVRLFNTIPFHVVSCRRKCLISNSTKPTKKNETERYMYFSLSMFSWEYHNSVLFLPYHWPISGNAVPSSIVSTTMYLHRMNFWSSRRQTHSIFSMTVKDVR